LCPPRVSAPRNARRCGSRWGGAEDQVGVCCRKGTVKKKTELPRRGPWKFVLVLFGPAPPRVNQGDVPERPRRAQKFRVRVASFQVGDTPQTHPAPGEGGGVVGGSAAPPAKKTQKKPGDANPPGHPPQFEFRANNKF